MDNFSYEEFILIGKLIVTYKGKYKGRVNELTTMSQLKQYQRKTHSTLGS